MPIRIEIVAKQKADHPPCFTVSVQDDYSKPDDETDLFHIGWKRQFGIISERVGRRVITYDASRDDYSVSAETKYAAVLVCRAPTFPLAVEAAAKDLERVYRPEVEKYEKEARAMGDAAQWLFREADVKTDEFGSDCITDKDGGRAWTFSMLAEGGADENAETEDGEEAP